MRTLRASWLTAIALWVSGCPAPVECVDAPCRPLETPPGRAVIIERNLLLFAEDGGRSELPDVTSLGAELYVDDGTTFQRLASRSTDRQVIVPEVPVGSFFVREGTSWIVDTSDFIDLGYSNVGRPTAEVVPTGATTVSLMATGLSAWAEGDSVVPFSAGAGLYGYNFAGALASAPVAGQVPSSFVFDYAALSPPESPGIDARQGDVLYLNHLKTTALSTDAGAAVSGFGCSFSAEAAVLTSVTTEPGAVTWSASFTQNTGPQASLAFPRTAWAARAVEAHPQARVAAESLAGVAEPVAGGISADLFVCTNDPRTQSPIADATALWALADVFPAQWPRVTYARVTFLVEQTLVSETWTSRGHLGRRLIGGEAVVPTVHAPVGFSVQGIEASRLSTLEATARVTLSWTAASLPPTPTNYQVNVERLTRDLNGAVLRTTLASIWTREAGLVLPPGLLQSGGIYQLLVRAEVASMTPHRPNDRIVHAYADAVSNPFAVQ